VAILLIYPACGNAAERQRLKKELARMKLSGAGHFPPTEIPDEVDALIEEFVATL
jgi:pimeloyl-ACP methyl ester carboxylesterase